MKRILSLSIILLAVLVLSACGGDHKAAPNYKAHIVNMTVSGATYTATAPRMASLLTEATTTTQDFYSGDISSSSTTLSITITIKNDSDVPLTPILMSYWAPAGFPYQSVYGCDNNCGIIEYCVGISPATLQPGEEATVVVNNSVASLNDPSILGSQQFSAYAYAGSEAIIQSGCQPSPWDGTLQGMINYTNSNPPLATATNHFTIVP